MVRPRVWRCALRQVHCARHFRSQNLGQPEPRVLPPIEDRFGDVRREEVLRKQPADVSVLFWQGS